MLVPSRVHANSGLNDRLRITVRQFYSPDIHPQVLGFSGLQVRGVVRLFSFLKLYELGELKEMAIVVTHVNRGPKRSMRKDVWIRHWPTVINTKLKVRGRGRGWQDSLISRQTWLWIYWWRKINYLGWMIRMSRHMSKTLAFQASLSNVTFWNRPPWNGTRWSSRFNILVVKYVVKNLCENSGGKPILSIVSKLAVSKGGVLINVNDHKSCPKIPCVWPNFIYNPWNS